MKVTITSDISPVLVSVQFWYQSISGISQFLVSVNFWYQSSSEISPEADHCLRKDNFIFSHPDTTSITSHHHHQDLPQGSSPTSPIREVHTCIFQPPPHIITTSSPPSTHAPCHVPTHARPSLPVIQDPNPAPPNLGPVALHDTAARC